MKLLSALLALILTLAPCAVAERTREEVRDAWRKIEAADAAPYAQAPAVSAPYASGELTAAALDNALASLNFIRWLAGLEPVRGSEIYNYQCQHAAVLLAALDYVDHNAPRPADMDGNFFDSAHIGTTSGNIARFNWMRDSILREGVEYFARDDGDQNLPMLGHRRWLLNPAMSATGFGLANAASGMSYVVMYAHDLGRPDARWESVCWPSEGLFPAELMHRHLAWSVSLNPEVYDLAASDPVVTLREPPLGLAFRFRPASGEGDGYCCINMEGYGSGGCVIFRPDFEGTGFTDYLQNQHWQVRIEGLRRADGGEASLEYGVDMISLYVQDPANIEITPLEAHLRPGETAKLNAFVIPNYADDLSVTWTSSDPAVAEVDGEGVVTAMAAGSCRITCADALGHTDACTLTVE